MDVVSDDGAYVLVVIVLLGNPFSPGYARARARGDAEPLDFCSLHVALHGPRLSAWSLGERSVPDSKRRPYELALGRSHVAIDGDALAFDIHERMTPMPGVIEGRVTLHPMLMPSTRVPLDHHDRHSWWPVAPIARVEVDLRLPRVRFKGHGYHDANAGTVPIEDSFSGWTWSRSRIGGRVAVAYDVVPRAGAEVTRGMVFGADGATVLDGYGRVRLPTTAWGLARSAVADRGEHARIVRSLTDSPFYARSLVEAPLFGEPSLAVHEVLSADRLRRAWVRFLLGFRMARSDR